MELSGNIKIVNICSDVCGEGGRWEGSGAEYKGLQSGRKNKYFQRIQFDFLFSTYFTLLSEIKGNPISDCLFSIRNFCSGRPVRLRALRNKRPSYATEHLYSH